MKKEKKDGKIIIKISIMWLFVVAIICTLSVAFFKNDIFASNETKENDNYLVSSEEKEKNNAENAKQNITSNEEKELEKIGIEKNQNAVDILALMVSNNYYNKKIVNEERDIEFETKKQDDNQVPKGEEVIEVKGQVGKKQVKAIQEYSENTYLTEQIIEETVKSKPVTQIVHVGTSEFLAKYKVHIGEEMFLTEKTDLKKEPKEDSETVKTLNRYLNFEVVEVLENWTKIKYKETEGYLPNDKLTSEAITPLVKEKNRIAQLQANLSIDMDLSVPSGLTLSDFKTVLGYNKSDKNNIFSDNVEVFYNAEQTYGINGIFLAAIGIHESAWGTSYLAREKNNLFGYKAYDRDPINSAQDFETYEDCINTVAEAVSKNYLTSKGSYYNGTTVAAVNVKYATDQAWHEKVFSYMEYLYDKLG